MATFISRSPDETFALGERWGREAQPAWVIGLSGDLGAGKTRLIQGLARGLGITAPVRSPTFALVHAYADGRLPLVHLDFYRLDMPEQIRGAGLEEFLTRPAGVTAVEWAERWWSDVQGSRFKVQRSTFNVQGPAFEAPSAPSAPSPIGLGVRYRHVWLECLRECERRITYEDFGP